MSRERSANSCNFDERVSLLSKLVPPSPDYWVVIWDTGSLQYVLSNKGLRVYGSHREPGLPILSKQELQLRVVPRKVVERLCSDEVLGEIYSSIKEFYEKNREYLDPDRRLEIEENIRKLREMLASRKEAQ